MTGGIDFSSNKLHYLGIVYFKQNIYNKRCQCRSTNSPPTEIKFDIQMYNITQHV